MSSLRPDYHKQATFSRTIPTDDPLLLPFLDLANFSCAWQPKINGNQWRLIEKHVFGAFTGIVELLKAFACGSWFQMKLYDPILLCKIGSCLETLSPGCPIGDSKKWRMYVQHAAGKGSSKVVSSQHARTFGLKGWEKRLALLFCTAKLCVCSYQRLCVARKYFILTKAEW